VKKHYFFASFLFAYLAVYVGAILYSVLPGVLKLDAPSSQFTTQMNSTISTTTNALGMTALAFVILPIILIIAVLLSGFTMCRAL